MRLTPLGLRRLREILREKLRDPRKRRVLAHLFREYGITLRQALGEEKNRPTRTP
jgi:hypothetical protein